MSEAPTPPQNPSTAAIPALSIDEGPFISFLCKKCGQEIEAPLEMVGTPNECPTCAEHLTVPFTSEPGTTWFQARAMAPQKFVPTPASAASMKGRTIRIELPDDI